MNATTHFLKHFEEIEDPDATATLMEKIVKETPTAEPQFNNLFEV